jgi:hypothetical protein
LFKRIWGSEVASAFLDSNPASHAEDKAKAKAIPRFMKFGNFSLVLVLGIERDLRQHVVSELCKP